MTDPKPPVHRDHLDTDTVADLIENLLPATEAHRARDHVKACPHCQQTYDALIDLSTVLAEEGRSEIPAPAYVAEHLDAVIVSESVLRSSTIGVHSLARLREQPRRHLPKLLLAAAGVLAVAAVGIGVVLRIADQSADNTAGIQPTDEAQPATVTLPTLTTTQLGAEVQKLLEGSTGSVMSGPTAERGCASGFANGQQHAWLRMVQPASVDKRRVTLVGMQAYSQSDVRVYVLDGCATGSSPKSEPSVLHITSVTLRNR